MAVPRPWNAPLHRSSPLPASSRVYIGSVRSRCTDERTVDADAFNAFEAAGWEKAAGYETVSFTYRVASPDELRRGLLGGTCGPPRSSSPRRRGCSGRSAPPDDTARRYDVKSELELPVRRSSRPAVGLARPADGTAWPPMALVEPFLSPRRRGPHSNEGRGLGARRRPGNGGKPPNETGETGETMRPFRTSAIALSLVAWAVFAGPAGAAPSSDGEDGAVITFSRAPAPSGTERVWHVVGERALDYLETRSPQTRRTRKGCTRRTRTTSSTTT